MAFNNDERRRLVMDEAQRHTGADFKGAPSPAATRQDGLESGLVIAFIVVAVAAIGALVVWAM
jgi:hypothetical protein